MIRTNAAGGCPCRLAAAHDGNGGLWRWRGLDWNPKQPTRSRNQNRVGLHHPGRRGDGPGDAATLGRGERPRWRHAELQLQPDVTGIAPGLLWHPEFEVDRLDGSHRLRAHALHADRHGLRWARRNRHSDLREGLQPRPPRTSSFLAEVQPVFDAKCTGACHSEPNTVAGFLPLTAAKSYAALVNVPATVRLLPAAPGQARSIRTARCSCRRWAGLSCGNRMPFDNPVYFDSALPQLDAVRTWIQQGAPNN